MTATLRSLLVASLVLSVGACGSDPAFPVFPDAATLDSGDGGTTEDAEDTDRSDTGEDTPPTDAGEDTPPTDVSEDTSPTDTGGDTPPTDADEDAPPSDTGDDVATDTGPTLGQIGDDCERNSECESTICIPVEDDRNVCSRECADDECPAGWECEGESPVCLCSATIEICDAVDNDCDGDIDEGATGELGCTEFETCTEGACVCPGGSIQCEGVCTDTARDSANCGGCGTVCTDGTICSDSECICPEEFIACEGLCVNDAEDPLNCGGCGVVCPEGLTCAGGECQCPGEDGRFCFDECVDSASDIDNCGGCGVRCRVTETCTSGECACPADWDRCSDGLCVESLRDPTNCGGCGVECGGDEFCGDGECTCNDGLDRCDGVCLNTLTDESDCGGCGIECDPGDVCAGGECGCPEGLSGCADGCFDTTSDEANCGGCGIACEADQVCNSSSCECACPGDSCDLGTCIGLPAGADPETITFTFTPDPQQADIAISMDTTGSMGGEIAAVQSALRTTIIPAASEVFANTAFSVSSFDDFPCGAFGAGTDRPFILYQRMTSNSASAQAGVDALERHGGQDFPESGIEALFQIATGVGRNEPGCISGYEVAAFNPTRGRIPGEADGEIGGVGFRDGSFPIVVHVTDAPSHARGLDGYPYGATEEEAYAALNAIGARVVGVASGTSARDGLLEVATATNTRVPTCAWGSGGDRPSDCDADACCTATGGTGRGPDSDGLCPLVFDISGTGAGLDESVVSGINVLARFSPFDVRLRVRPDAAFLEAGFDTSCLVAGTELLSVGTPPDDCGFEPAAADFDDDGVIDGATGVTAGIPLEFGFELDSECAEEPGVYPVRFDIVAGEAASFASVIVYVYVP